MYRPTKLVDWYQCCTRGIAFPNAKCAADFFGNDNSPQIVHSSDNACSFHISFSFSAHPLPPALVREVAARRADGGSKTPPVSFADSPLFKAGAKAAPTIILQITLLVSVNKRRLYRRIYFLLS